MPRNNEDFLASAGFTPEEQESATSSAVEGAGDSILSGDVAHEAFHAHDAHFTKHFLEGDAERLKFHARGAHKANLEHISLTGKPLVDPNGVSFGCLRCGE